MNRRASLPAVLLALLLSLPWASAPAADAVPAAVTRSLVGGPGGWDYLTMDAEGHRLFIARADRVQVFDTRALRVVAEIAGTAGVHGVALAPKLRLGVTSNGKSHSATVFDLASLQPVAQVDPVGDGPDAVVFDARSARAITFNGRSNDATAIDPVGARVLATIALPGRPESAVSDEAGSVFVNIEDRNALARLDTATLKLVAQWPLPGCDGPTGLAIDAPRRRLFVSCGNRSLMVVDADSGAIVARLPIGAGSDAVAFDEQKALVLSSNRDGTLSLIRQIDADHYMALPALSTRPGARTLALDPLTQRVHLVTADFEAPASAPERAAPARPIALPGTFSVLTVDLSTYPDR